MYYWLVRKIITDEAFGVVKTDNDSAPQGWASSYFEPISEAQYETYIEFGLEDKSMYGAIMEAKKN